MGMVTLWDHPQTEKLELLFDSGKEGDCMSDGRVRFSCQLFLCHMHEISILRNTTQPALKIAKHKVKLSEDVS